jgi:transposase
VHSHYTRKLQDLPIQGKKVRLVLENYKYFCLNKDCSRKTFVRQFDFFARKATRTKRLQDEILRLAVAQSSVSAAKYLRNSVADIGKSSVCTLLKKTRENA